MLLFVVDTSRLVGLVEVDCFYNPKVWAGNLYTGQADMPCKNHAELLWLASFFVGNCGPSKKSLKKYENPQK